MPHAEIHVRLLTELAQPPQIELISASDFKRLLSRSEFQCPKYKNIQGLCLNPNSCPPRPKPCETCQSWKKYKRFFKAKTSTQLKINLAFNALQKNCKNCELPNKNYDEPDYFDECRRAIRARHTLERINKGEIQVKQSEGPVFG